MEINLNTNIAAQTTLPDAQPQAEASVKAAAAQPAAQEANLTVAISEALISYGIKPSKENMEIAELLLKAGMSVNADNLKLANQAHRLLDGNEAKILFFLENQIRVNPQNAELLNLFAEHKTLAAELLNNLFDSLVTAEQNSSATAPKLQALLQLLGINTPAQTELSTPLPVQTIPQGQTTAQTQAQPSNGTAQPQGVFTGQIQTQNAYMPQVPENILFSSPLASQDAPSAQPGAAQSGGAIEIPPALSENFPQKLTPQEIQTSAKELLSLTKTSTEFNTVLSELIKAYPKEETALRETARDVQNEAKETFTPRQTADALQTAAKTPVELQDTARLILQLFPDIEARAKLANTLILKEGPLQIKTALLNKFFIEPGNFSKQEFTTLMKALDNALRSMPSMSADTGRDVREPATGLRDTIQFLNQIRNDSYIQIPLIHGNNGTTGELYIFKDKRKTAKKDGDLSALVALDTENLGRFETYIVKRGATVNLQFRLSSPECEKLVKTNLPLLKEALSACGISVSDVRYKKITEKFNLITTEPDNDEQLFLADRVMFDKKL